MRSGEPVSRLLLIQAPGLDPEIWGFDLFERNQSNCVLFSLMQGRRSQFDEIPFRKKYIAQIE